MATKRNQNGCEDCGYTWFPRGKNRSANCPQCGSGSVVVYARARAKKKKKKGCLLTKVALVLFGFMILGALIPDGDTESDGNEAVEVQKVAKQTEPKTEAGVGESSDTPENEAKHPDDQIAKEISDDSMGEETNSENTEERPEQEIAKPDSEELSVAEKSDEIAPKSVRTPKFDPVIKGNISAKMIGLGKMSEEEQNLKTAQSLFLRTLDHPDTRVIGVNSKAESASIYVKSIRVDHLKLFYDRELHILCYLRRTEHPFIDRISDNYKWIVWKNIRPEDLRDGIPYEDASLPQLKSEAKNHKQFPIRYTHNGTITNWP